MPVDVLVPPLSATMSTMLYIGTSSFQHARTLNPVLPLPLPPLRLGLEKMGKLHATLLSAWKNGLFPNVGKRGTRDGHCTSVPEGIAGAWDRRRRYGRG